MAVGQFFADPVTSLTLSATPTGQSGTYGNIYAPTIWSGKAIKAREPMKLLVKYCLDYSDEISGNGSTINIDTIANMVANQKIDQQQVTLQQPVGANTPIQVNRYFEASMLVEDDLAWQSKLNLMEQYVPKGVEIVERKKDNDLAAQYANTTQTVVGTGASVITDANFIQAVQQLDLANVPQDGRHFIVSPTARAQLLKIDKYLGVVLGASTTAPGTIQTKPIVETGMFGTIYNIPVNMTTNLVPVTGGGYHNLMFHDSALAVAVQKETDTLQNYIPQYLGTLAVTRGLWGRTTVRPDHIIDFQSL